MPVNRKWALKLFRRGNKHIAGDSVSPMVLHRWALIEQAIDYGPPSYSWAGSWATRLDTMGRETWFVEATMAATMSKRSFVCIIPWDPDNQVYDPKLIAETDRLILVDNDPDSITYGQEYGEFKLNLVFKTAVKVELNLEMIQ